MAALTENRYTKHRDGLVTAHPVKTGTKIFKGSLVCLDDTGHAVPGADSAGFRFCGVAIETADNSGGADGDIRLRVQTMGVFSFAKSGSATQADSGLPLNVVDDQTVTLDPTVNSVNLNGVFIAATQDNTQVRLDLDNDGDFDAVDTNGDGAINPGAADPLCDAATPNCVYTVNSLASLRVFDPNDYDNTGTRIIANKPVAVAWGQDTDLTG